MKSNSIGLANYIVQQVNETGYSTVNVLGFSPADGYLVAGLSPEEIWPLELVEQALPTFIQSHTPGCLEDPECYVGARLDPGTGCVHLSVCERYAGRNAERTAKGLGMARDQEAVYCLNTQESISLKKDLALKRIGQSLHEGD